MESIIWIITYHYLSFMLIFSSHEISAELIPKISHQGPTCCAGAPFQNYSTKCYAPWLQLRFVTNLQFSIRKTIYMSGYRWLKLYFASWTQEECSEKMVKRVELTSDWRVIQRIEADMELFINGGYPKSDNLYIYIYYNWDMIHDDQQSYFTIPYFQTNCCRTWET